MGSFGDYLEDEIIDHVLKVGSFGVPSDIYVALSTADPTDDGSGLAEPSGNGYARVQSNSWDAAVERGSQNTNLIQFPTATGAWGTITHWTLMDAVSGGNMLIYGSFAVSRAVANGQTFTIAAGEIDVSFNSGGASTYLAHAVLDHVLKTTPYTQPTNIYVALTTTIPTDSMSGSSIEEPPTNYARVLHNSWVAASGGISSNNGAIAFVEATTDWGTIVGLALVDALTGGNVLLHGELDTSQDLVIADTVSFQDGELDVTWD